MGKKLLDPRLIDEIYSQTDASAAQLDKSAAEREARLASLRAQRQDILRDRFGARLMTEPEARDMLQPIDAEINALEARTPAAAPSRRVNATEFLKKIAGYFARYALKSLEKQRGNCWSGPWSRST
jgi:hypothetical protein